MKSQIVFEVRIPACDRPEMLCRALQSLQAQNYPHWKAIVYDDSSSADVQDVVKCAVDGRISYCRNPERFGAAKNIDQCFAPRPLLGGDYACLLEDDNFWLSGFLSLIADYLVVGTWNLILANQIISEGGAGLRPSTDTTRGGWFSAGPVTPLNLRALLLLMEGLSNGGLVWRLDGSIDLQVGPFVQETGLHEACRSLLVRSPFLFVEETLAVWTSMPKSETARAMERNRVIGRGMQSIRDFVLDQHGDSAVRIAARVASSRGLMHQLSEAVSYSGYLSPAYHRCRGHHWKIYQSFAKGWAIRFLERDPCAAFLESGRAAAISDLTTNAS